MHSKLSKLLRHALEEDVPFADITYECVLRKNPLSRAVIKSNASGTFYGELVIKMLFQISEPESTVTLHVRDSDRIQPGQVLCVIEGTAKTILRLERVMLNLIQRLSGIATLTRAFVDKLDNEAVQILDTRKTTPGLRFLEKKAVLAGGGANHRAHLSDMVLVKENYLAALKLEGGEDKFYSRISDFKLSRPEIPIEIEIDSFSQLEKASLEKVDYVLFDNFSIEDIKRGVLLCKERGWPLEIEVSGNVSLDTIHLYRDLGIHRISIGALTHSAKALDFSLLIE